MSVMSIERPKAKKEQFVINGDIKAPDTGKYDWAKTAWKNGVSNHWMPQEIAMGKDKEQWECKDPRSSDYLTPEEKKVVIRTFGFFATADSLAANNIVLGTKRHFTSPAIVRYLDRQGFEEAIHTHTYQYIVESLGIDEQEIFNAYNEIQTTHAKDQFLMPFIDTLTDPEFKTGTFENDQKLLKSIIMFGAVMEGLMFYGGFANVFALGRQNKLPGTCSQIQLIARDESLHSKFGIDLAKTIIHENPQLWTPAFKADLAKDFVTAVNLEIDFIREMIPKPMFGISAKSQEDYIKYLCNRRCEQIKIPELYPEVRTDPEYNGNCPLPWMSEMLDMKKEVNFFEKRVVEYQNSGNLNFSL